MFFCIKVKSLVCLNHPERQRELIVSIVSFLPKLS
jgi:hypothetical protein